VLAIAGSALIAAQKYPGQSTDARVWIENRTKPEAIAVTLQDVAPDTVMTVHAASLPPVQIAGGVERRRQRWEYAVVVVKPGQDIPAELNRAGADSWEAVGSPLQDSAGMTFVLKRPK
jgi:hypothetical protein